MQNTQNCKRTFVLCIQILQLEMVLLNTERKNSQSKINANMRYAAKTYKRIPLDIKKESAEILKDFCNSINVGVNTYIKQAVKEKYLNDTGSDIDL